MRLLKLCLYAVGFFTCYALFVHVNAQTISDTGGWCDLNWLGTAEVRGRPCVTFALAAAFDNPSYAVFNLIVVGALWLFEFKFLRLWQQKEKQ